MNDPRVQRKTRFRKKVANVTQRARLSVDRSNRYCYVQLIDNKGQTLAGVSEKALLADGSKATPMDRARALGLSIAKVAKEKKITEVVFDKGRFAYHGRVKAIAEGAREGGLQF